MIHKRSVEWPHYHIWTDALHGRHLARIERNAWNRGTYVRWTIVSAWTAFELACNEALGCSVGRRFKERMKDALGERGIVFDWSSGLWQHVLAVNGLRASFVHQALDGELLFADVERADQAVSTLRAALHDLHNRLGTGCPSWIDDDQNAEPRRRGGIGGSASISVTHGDFDRDHPGCVKVSTVRGAKEHIGWYLPPGSDPEPYMQQCLDNASIPLNAIRAYVGDALTHEWVVRMRDSEPWEPGLADASP